MKHIKEFINGNIVYHGIFVAVLFAIGFATSFILGVKTEEDFPSFIIILQKIAIIDIIYFACYWFFYRLIIRQWIMKK